MADVATPMGVVSITPVMRQPAYDLDVTALDSAAAATRIAEFEAAMAAAKGAETAELGRETAQNSAERGLWAQRRQLRRQQEYVRYAQQLERLAPNFTDPELLRQQTDWLARSM